MQRTNDKARHTYFRICTLKKIAYKQNDWKQYVLLDQKYTSMHDSLHAQGEMESIRKYQALYDHQETELKLTKEQAKNAVSNLRIIIVMIVCFFSNFAINLCLF